MIKCEPSYLFQFRLVLVIAIFLLLMPVSALAYLDPTTGSMVISAIVGLFASLVLAIKTYWYRIKVFLNRKPVQTGAGGVTNTDTDADRDTGDGAA
ncbi:MAG: hypothetical protein BMS9Abin30_0770 [Gammaproteobacteria bacterium]|nr:MAG: hypothetical protein BMS9Abin30_0770 [Gammaproteobacteria bacterium]